jgi:quinol monooxygenase YgiN
VTSHWEIAFVGIVPEESGSVARWAAATVEVGEDWGDPPPSPVHRLIRLVLAVASVWLDPDIIGFWLSLLGGLRMAEIARLARFRIDPSRRDGLFAAYAEYAEAVREEDGVRVWEMCTEADDENVVWLFVRSADAAAHEAHRSSSAAERLGSVLIPAIVGDPEFHDLVPNFSNLP